MFYSGKKKRHTIKYEVSLVELVKQIRFQTQNSQVAVRITDGIIVWVAGPCPGSAHDLTMYQTFGLKEQLIPGELLIGDK